MAGVDGGMTGPEGKFARMRMLARLNLYYNSEESGQSRPMIGRFYSEPPIEFVELISRPNGFCEK